MTTNPTRHVTSRLRGRRVRQASLGTGLVYANPLVRSPALADRGLGREGVPSDDPVVQAVTCQRVTFDALAPRCGRYGCASGVRVN